MSDWSQQFKDLLKGASGSPILIHSDLLKASAFVGKFSKRNELLAAHTSFLSEVLSGPIFFPVFNYDFCGTRKVDLRVAKSQVGPLGEFVRNLKGTLRTNDSIFSMCYSGELKSEWQSPQVNEEAFGEDSYFAKLDEANGSVLFYGAPFSSATIIHYIESLSGGPVYRYDKIFSGELTDLGGDTHSVNYNYHVRPMGKSIDYDWSRIESDLEEQGILRTLRDRGTMLAGVMPIHDLKRYWLSKLKEDPFYLLDSASKEWVVPLASQLGRRFQLNDFE